MKNEKFSNKVIADLLRSIAGAYLIKNENRFKIIAYEKAADTVEHLNRELFDLWKEGKITKVPGLGPSISSSIDEYFSTGHSKHFDSILKDIPQSVFILMRIPSIGPKKASKLVQTLHLNNPETIVTDIIKAARENKIAVIPTFGEKSQEDILTAVERFQKNKNAGQRMPLPYAYELAQEIIAYLKQLPEVKRVEALGSLRRMVSTIGDVDLVVGANKKDIQKIVQHFINYPHKIALDNAGDEKASIIVPPDIRVDLRVQEEENFGPMLQYFTGNKAHNIKLREYALKKGYSLSEHGITTAGNQKYKKKVIDDKLLTFKTEKEFYNYIGVPFIPPEIREGTDEIELASKNKLPSLVELEDIKGDLHLHSSYDIKPSHDSGANTYTEIVEKGQQLGYEYVGFADHNPRTSKTTEEEIISIMKQRKEYIADLFKNKNYKTKYFIGLETDITPSGELALPEKAIEYVDYLIVSVHSVFSMEVEEMTNRVLKALSYPKVKILGHPTGRLLGKRPGFELDWEKIFDFVKKKNIALEINSWYQRLDLPDMLVREAKNLGIRFCIDTDAHAVDQMNQMFYGISVARRGWCEKKDIVNAMSYEEFGKWLKNTSG